MTVGVFLVCVGGLGGYPPGAAAVALPCPRGLVPCPDALPWHRAGGRGQGARGRAGGRGQGAGGRGQGAGGRGQGAALPCPALPSCPALPCPALPAPPRPARPCPALPCPALGPSPALCSTSSSPDRAREGPGCLLETCFSSSGGTGRKDPQPDTNPSQLCFAVFGRLYIELRKEAESKKAPLEGGLGGEP